MNFMGREYALAGWKCEETEAHATVSREAAIFCINTPEQTMRDEGQTFSAAGG
jgi:hypothetical protein